MIQHPDGSWEPKEPIAIHTSSGGQVTLKPGIRMKPGVIFLGIDIAQILDTEID